MALPAESVAGQSILVTGAARGIGAETARRLASMGARVSLVGLEAELLEEVAASCGPEAVWFEADVTDRAALERAVSGTVARSGGIDVVIANAGVGAAGTVRTMDEVAWERVIEINLLGSYRTVRACLPHVIDRSGHVLIVASVSALVHDSPGLSAYAASKAGAEAFGDALRVEVAHLGVSVGVAYFPWVATDMIRGADRTSPTFREFRSRLKGPMAKDQPLSVAVDAVVRGVERRSPRVVAPRWVWPLMLMRGLLGPMVERDARKTAPEIVRASEAQSLDIGAGAYAPVGEGGAAAARSAEQRDTVSGVSG